MSRQTAMQDRGPAPGEPAYARIKRFVTERIGAGTLKEGHQVPSEAELVRLFKVSRMTAHRALRELSADGVLKRVQGLGTFVAVSRVPSTVVEIRTIYKEIESRGNRHDAVVLALESVRLRETGAPLALPRESNVFHALILHRENGIPVQLEDRYVNPEVAPAFLRQDYTQQAPGDYLTQVAPISRAEHSIEALAPARRIARLLKLSPGEPCLVLTRLTWSNKRPAAFARLFHPGSRFRFTSDLQIDSG